MGFGVSVPSLIPSLSSLGHSTSDFGFWELPARGTYISPSRRAGPCSRGLPSAIADCMLGARPGAWDPEAGRLFPGSPFLPAPLEGHVLSATLLSLYPSSCLVEAGFLSLQWLSLASFRVLSLISLFCLTCRNIFFIVVPRNLDSWCVGASFLFWGVQDRQGLVYALGEYSGSGARLPALPSQCPGLPKHCRDSRQGSALGTVLYS